MKECMGIGKVEKYGIKMKLDEVQNAAYDILVYFDSFCEEHNIQYMLAYGTLLGAVRHKGFIPWDDDIDVMLTRPNYCKLVKAFESEKYLYNRYQFVSIHNNDEYFAPLAKIYDSKTKVVQHYGQIEKPEIGLYIDLFIIEALPINEKKQIECFKEADKLRKAWGLSCRKFSAKSKNIITAVIKTIISVPFRIIGYRYFAKRLDSLCSGFDYESSQQVAVMVYGEGRKKEVFDKKFYDERTQVQFNAKLFWAPLKYDIYLRQIYGDYMKLPPIEQRVSKHGSDFYWKE